MGAGEGKKKRNFGRSGEGGPGGVSGGLAQGGPGTTPKPSIGGGQTQNECGPEEGGRRRGPEGWGPKGSDPLSTGFGV